MASAEFVEIYVALLGENTDVWRPVRASHVSDSVYRILEQPYDRQIETWEFAPGAEVVCEGKVLDNKKVLVAVSGRPGGTS